MRFDLLIRGGRVVDPACGVDGVRDIAVRAGRIAAVDDHGVDPSSAFRVIEAAGRLVTPGLIDLHTHVFHGFTYWGVDPDTIGPRTGVTTWVDAGSAGAMTLPGFHQHIVRESVVGILAFLNISYVGLVGPDFELRPEEYVDAEVFARVAHRYRDLVAGIKVRMGSPTVGDRGIAPLQTAREVADRCELPIMVHIADAPPAIDDVLPLLGAGDLVTHCFSGASMRLVDDAGRPRDAVRRALDAGVLLDVGHGAGGMTFASAQAMIEGGFAPHVISSDLHQMSIFGPGVLSNDAAASALIRVDARQPPDFDLVSCLDKFLALGMSLPNVIERATSAPASVLGRSGSIGTLRVGAQADIAIFEVEQGDFVFYDTVRTELPGRQRLRNVTTLIAGREITARGEHVPAPWVDLVTVGKEDAP